MVRFVLRLIFFLNVTSRINGPLPLSRYVTNLWPLPLERDILTYFMDSPYAYVGLMKKKPKTDTDIAIFWKTDTENRTDF
jgi:hypothetical protein